MDIICRNLSADILVFHKENGGVSSALNYGLKVMSGEWFIWLSHDDVLEENFVSTAISVCGEYDVVSQNTLHIDEIGNHLKF